ncbi:MAG: hypothetical protein MUF42_00350 [Cytophagaceae bacterium]|jgi:hypothetical protein|nr:hypothetical protein [Cytophagaceae bacterium]
MNRNSKTVFTNWFQWLGLLCWASLSAQPYYVYDDKFTEGSPSGLLGEKGGTSISQDAACTVSPFKGNSCWKVKMDGTESWSVLFVYKNTTARRFLPPETAMADLSSHKYLVFHAKAESEGLLEKVGIGEEGEPKSEQTKIPLTTSWKRYVLEVPQNATSLNGLFLLVFTRPMVVYLDEIYFTSSIETNVDDLVLSGRKVPKDTSSYYIFMDGWERGIPSGFMGEKNGISMKIDPDCRFNPYLGPKCLKFAVDNSEAWRGLYIFSSGKWNVMLNDWSKLPDMSQYTALEFYARAECTKNRPYILSEIGVGAGDMNEERVNDVSVEITNEWKRYRISLKGVDREKLNTLLYMVLPTGTLYLDEIRFVR